MKIVVLDGYTLNPGDTSWEPIEALGDLKVHDRTAPELVLERSESADILVVNKALMPREVIESLPSLKFISVMATGYNVVDVQAARERNIDISNVPVYSTTAVAQHVFAALLSFNHGISEHVDSVRRGDWVECNDFSYWYRTIHELAGKTMGIVGFGQIGRATAKLADAFGMKVIVHTRTPKNAPDYEGFEWADLESVFQRADVVSLHCPQTADNVGFVNESLLSQMKPTAILVNTARGLLVNERDLASALNQSKIAGACLDVVAEEPMRAANPLRRAKNCMITPHIAWAAIESRQRLMHTTAENIAAFIAGNPINVVN